MHLDQRGKEHCRIADIFGGPKSKTEQLHSGAKVWIQDHKTKRWSIEATIVSTAGKRSYRVNDGMREFTRNRRFIRCEPRLPLRQETSQRVGHMIGPGPRNGPSPRNGPGPKNGPGPRSGRDPKSRNTMPNHTSNGYQGLRRSRRTNQNKVD